MNTFGKKSKTNTFDKKASKEPKIITKQKEEDHKTKEKISKFFIMS
jgi:hypothetical protein